MIFSHIRPLTHALRVMTAISLLNRLSFCRLLRPPTAPVSSIRSHMNWQRTWICWRVRNASSSSSITCERYWTALERTVASSLLIYSPSNWMTSIRLIFLDLRSIWRHFQSSEASCLGSTLSCFSSDASSCHLIAVGSQKKSLEVGHRSD